MHRCEFCHVMFESRPQVKQPRACKDCQGKRQRRNEEDWRGRHKGIYDGKYQQIQKKERLKKLKEMAERIIKLIEVGKGFLGEALDLKEMGELLHRFFIYCGIRSIKQVLTGTVNQA